MMRPGARSCRPAPMLHPPLTFGSFHLGGCAEGVPHGSEARPTPGWACLAATTATTNARQVRDDVGDP